MADRDVPELSLGDVLAESDSTQVGERQTKRIARPAGEPRPARLEPIFWLSFSAGGMVAAFLFPIHLMILGIAYAAGWLPHDALSYARVVHVVHNPLVKVYLWGLVSLPLYHWAHRFRYIVRHQFGIEAGARTVAFACYGIAVAGTVLTGLVLLRI
jgi:fumarate reductase subunit D